MDYDQIYRLSAALPRPPLAIRGPLVGSSGAYLLDDITARFVGDYADPAFGWKAAIS